jgi:DNA gyrase subunit A
MFQEVNIEDEMKVSYIDYAMSVIVGRALPDVRDGLKPVHRRILHAMRELGVGSAREYKKSARIVGEVLGKYHPHGDAAVYDTMVRMAQDFSFRYPLIDGQGNFGSVDGDDAAAMRYTETRLSEIAEEILEDIEKDTVEWSPNFDDTLKEPTILPAKIPNVLVNGSSGIAVGMATNLPPHNLGEVANGIIMVIENPDVSIEELMGEIKGPDFPTGGIIVGREGIRKAYTTGRGILKIRAKVNVEGKAENRIVIREIPFQINKARLVEEIAELVREKKIEGITDLRDESDREGIRIVVELRYGISADVVLNRLYKYTQLETSFGVISLALVNGEPRELILLDIVKHYIEHRKEVVTRRTRHELEIAERRAHILEGYEIAIGRIDDVIKIVKESEKKDDASKTLQRSLNLSKEQAEEILKMRISSLSRLERKKIEKEHEELIGNISRLREVLSSEENILRIIKEELVEIKERYGDARRTMIVDEEELMTEDLVEEEKVVVTITDGGYIKRLPIKTFKMQRRGGRGIIGAGTKEKDFIVEMFIASTHDHALFFTDRGKVYRLMVHEIPAGERHSRGKAIVNLLNLEGEKITATIPINRFDDRYLLFATKRGIIKKTSLHAFDTRYRCIRAISLDEDELVNVELTDGNREVILATKHGKAIRFSERDVREMGRGARGVKGIKPREGDEVIAMETVSEDGSLLTVTENGYGKRTPVSKYRRIKRGGTGVINIKTSGRNGFVVDVKEVSDDDEIIIISSKGIVIREPVKDIRVQARSTQGVRLMRLREGMTVVALGVA